MISIVLIWTLTPIFVVVFVLPPVQKQTVDSFVLLLTLNDSHHMYNQILECQVLLNKHKIKNFRTCHWPNKGRYVKFCMFMSHVVANLKLIIMKNKNQDSSCLRWSLSGWIGSLSAMSWLPQLVLQTSLHVAHISIPPMSWLISLHS